MFEVELYWKVDGSIRTMVETTASEEDAIADVERIYGRHDVLIRAVRDLNRVYQEGMA
jgi:hypothetical protein